MPEKHVPVNDVTAIDLYDYGWHPTGRTISGEEVWLKGEGEKTEHLHFKRAERKITWMSSWGRDGTQRQIARVASSVGASYDYLIAR